MNDGRSALLDCLKSLEPDDPVIGFAQCPGGAFFVHRQGEKLSSPATSSIDLDAIFDLRLFDDDRELHWWWEGDNGRWAVLDDSAAKAHEWCVRSDSDNSRLLDSRLLRGTAREQKGWAGRIWTRMFDGQARSYWIPVTIKLGSRAKFGVVEYVGDFDGNTAVVGERLASIDTYEQKEFR